MTVGQYRELIMGMDDDCVIWINTDLGPVQIKSVTITPCEDPKNPTAILLS